MSALRISSSRTLRPHLSHRYQTLRRAESTASRHVEPLTSTASGPQPSFVKRNFSTIVVAWVGGIVGFAGGSWAVDFFAPRAMPVPGSPHDVALMADLERRIDADFKVHVLRGKCLGVARQLKGETSGMVEIVRPPPAEPTEDHGSDGNDADKTGLVARLQGARGLGVERVFWHAGEKRLTAVVWLGGALSGWPRVTHGGAIATALEEKLALANLLAADEDSGRAGVRAAAAPQRMPGTGNHAKMLPPSAQPQPAAELSLTYGKSVMANEFYVIRVWPALPEASPSDRMIPLKGTGGPEWDARLETLDARTCCTARASFAPATTLSASRAASTEAVKSTYADFREWMWPSRQQQLHTS